jgi:hypothetical protein
MMADIITFPRTLARARFNDGESRIAGSGEVIIFPGIRVEYWHGEPAVSDATLTPEWPDHTTGRDPGRAGGKSKARRRG